MRTTLKRGVGQSVDGSGNGRGFGFAPPGVLSAMRRYRQPPRRRTALGVVGRILLAVAAALVMILAALAGGAYLFFDQSVEAVQAHSRAVRESVTLLRAPPAGKPATALVVGYDKRFDEVGYGRSDTLMLVRADPIAKAISMLSFPRDLMVEIHCPGRAPYVDRINAAYAECSFKGSVATIKALTDLEINYLITVNFKGFRQVVDRLGGVWIDVDHRYYNRNVGTAETNFANINLRPGYQRLNGRQALEYVRFRHTDSDLYRNARQQAFVRAFKEQVSSLSAFDIPGVLSSITRNVEIGRGGGAGVSPSEVLRYARFAYTLPAGHFFQPKIEGITGYSELRAPPQNIEAAIREFVHPDVRAPEKAEEVILGSRPGKRRAIRPKDITVSVINGNAVQGSAATARALLRERGFRTVEPVNPAAANAPSQKYWHTVVYYDVEKKRAREAARRVANEFGDANVVRGIPPRLRRLAMNAMTVAVVGRTFHNQLAPAPIDKTPKKQPPRVRRDPSETLGMLREAQRRMPFRLEVPTLIEASSEPDSTMPIRRYTMEGHKTVRLVFQMPNGTDYWGIQQTDWADAPVLEKPNTTRFIKGRRFDLYFSGEHLRLVVLRENGATYWVVNSLGNALSNETMLAIAKGLRPLPQKGQKKRKKRS